MSNWRLRTSYLAPAAAANPNVTFYASSGDSGANFGAIYPSISPNVVSVGGTSLYLNANNHWQSETGWGNGDLSFFFGGSGGGISTEFAEPTYQQADGFDSGGFRTNPDVSADANPATGVAIYDPFDFGTATPWDQVGGTSLSAQLWAGMAAIADQGRVLNGGSPLGSTQTLTDLYHLENIAPGDFHDITQGNNGFSAGPGYDLVTGIGSPQANLLIPDLSAYGLASEVTIATQPPPSLVQGDSFGIVAEPTDPLGHVDLGYSGTATLSLVSGPAGASFTPVTVSIVRRPRGFLRPFADHLSNGTDYVFQVSMNGLSSATTDPVDVVSPRAGVSNYYPLPFDNSIRGAVLSADFDGSPASVITLSVSTLNYDISAGELPLFNAASGGKTISIVGQGASSSIVDAGGTSRVFEIIGDSSLSVVFQSLGIEVGDATDGGVLGLDAAVGGGVLIDGGQVAMSNVALMNNEAAGFSGSNGRNGHSATTSNPTGGDGGAGGAGGNAQGGGIYLYAGSLTLTKTPLRGTSPRAVPAARVGAAATGIR